MKPKIQKVVRIARQLKRGWLHPTRKEINRMANQLQETEKRKIAAQKPAKSDTSWLSKKGPRTAEDNANIKAFVAGLMKDVRPVLHETESKKTELSMQKALRIAADRVAFTPAERKLAKQCVNRCLQFLVLPRLSPEQKKSVQNQLLRLHETIGVIRTTIFLRQFRKVFFRINKQIEKRQRKGP